MKYEVMTFDALEMFQYAYEKNGLRAPTETLVFDLDSPLIRSRVLKSTIEQNDNALFYQIRLCLSQKDKKEAAQKEKQGEKISSAEEDGNRRKTYRTAQAVRESMKYHLVFVDFSRVYSQSDRMNPGYFLNALAGGKTKEEKEAARKEALRVLFTKGMELTFSEKSGDGSMRKVFRKFMPFDKSASMARTSRISFVDEGLLASDEGYAGLDERLRVGIDFSGIEVVNSKYLAYRGLYMSDGTRISNAELLLNEETVIVLPDGSFTDYADGTRIDQRVPASHDLEPFDFITAVPVKGEEKNPVFDFEVKKVSIRPGPQMDASENSRECNPAQELSDRARHVTAFDGEGLISPEYSALLNKCLRRKSAGHRLGHATSFQIRMPFTKGMLHEVDFHAFLKEQILFGLSGYRGRDEIYDAFGIRRDLSKVRIVLTESMFKSGKWLQEKDAFGRYLTGEDPMKFYFKKFHAYSHALYVCQTDLSYARDTARLSYQFLNTLYMSDDTLKGLVAGHTDKAHDIARVRRDECRARKNRKTQDAWEYAIASNRAFLRDPNIKDKLKAEKNAMLRNVSLGKIEVEGRQRYLAVDLLAFLLHMTSCLYCQNAVDHDFLKERINQLARHILYDYRFYLPGMDSEDSEFSPNESYAFLRSPHLSRNEECVLRPYMPQKKGEKNNLYPRYFSHLKGLVMVSYHSTAPLILGGADCDGDLVQVILDPSINNAILAGVYQAQRVPGPGPVEKFTCGKSSQRPAAEADTPEGKIRKQGTKIIYRRKLPTAVILTEQAEPHMPAEFGTEPYYSSMFDTIHDTFTSHIGMISNAAIRMGMKAYDRPVQSPVRSKEESGGAVDSARDKAVAGTEIDTQEAAIGGPVFDDHITGQDRCAVCTVLTGLDIDAAKNGRRPNLEKWLAEHGDGHKGRSGQKKAGKGSPKQADQTGEEELDALSDAAYFLSVKDTMDNLGDNYIISNLRGKTEVKAGKEIKKKRPEEIEGSGKSGNISKKSVKEKTLPSTKISIGYIRTDSGKKTFKTLVNLGDAEHVTRRTGIAVLPQLMEASLTDYRDEDVLVIEDVFTSETPGEEEVPSAAPAAAFRFMVGESGEPSDEWKAAFESGADREKLKELKKVLASYEEFRTFKRSVRNARKSLEDAHFIENVRFLLKVEYDQERDLSGIEGQNFSSALEISYAMLREYSSSLKETITMQERLVENRWAFLSGNVNRSEALYRIFGAGEDQEEREALDNLIGMESAKRLFLDRSETGYWILFYMLKDLETEQRKQVVLQNYAEDVTAGSADSGNAELLRKLVNRYIECEAQKKPNTKDTNRLLMEQVRKIFDQDMGTALRALVYLCDAGSKLSGRENSRRADDFLWQVFAEDREEVSGVPEEISCGYQVLVHSVREEEEEKEIEEAEIPEAEQEPDRGINALEEKEADHAG